MELSTEKRDVVKSHEFETMNYGVDASNLPLLFQLLRTNLYSDLHGSIVRELVSNVIDSHTEAGKPNTMGEVEWIPSSKILGVDCQLIIRDFGVGLSPDRMKNTFGNYLSSTKRDGNTQIGGFGLGSKVPFAYTDSFSVQTVFDGQKYRYLCYIDESQLGAISLLTQNETTEGNSSEIIIPIKDEHDDYKDFQEAILKQLAYFSTIRYKGFESPDPVILFENEHCIVKEEPPMSQLHVVLGNVAYLIDFNALGLDNYKVNDLGYANCGVGLKFSIGELQPTMSRESLYWNQTTKDKVFAKIEKAKKTVKKQIDAELAGEKDYAKWYAFASSGRTVSFPNQFQFANVKRDAEFTTTSGKKLQIQLKTGDWFAGHNVRCVTRYSGGRRRRGSSVNPDYSTGMPMASDLENLPMYQLEKNLSAATCLFLFRTHPNGFIAVSHLAPPDDKIQLPYYEETKRWMKTLPSYDDIDVPEDAPDTGTDERTRQYREMVKNRKLEGKFTAKKLRKDHNYHQNLQDTFIYNMFEGKFEDMKKDTIIYGFQTEHKKLCEVIAMLTLSQDIFTRFTDRTDRHGKVIDKPVTVLKIGQNYEKHFFAMPNAYHVDDILALDTPLKETLASIATAIRIKPYLHEYHTLAYFDHINKEMKTRYAEVHKFVEANAVAQAWNDATLQKQILELCANNLNEEMESEWQIIKDYLDGAGLLKSVNFAMYSSEHKGYGQDGDGTTTYYLRRWVSQSEPWIKEYLTLKGRQVDGGPEVPEQAKPSTTVLAVEPDVIVNDYAKLDEQVEEYTYDETTI